MHKIFKHPFHALDVWGKRVFVCNIKENVNITTEGSVMFLSHMKPVLSIHNKYNYMK